MVGMMRREEHGWDDEGEMMSLDDIWRWVAFGGALTHEIYTGSCNAKEAGYKSLKTFAVKNEHFVVQRLHVLVALLADVRLPLHCERLGTHFHFHHHLHLRYQPSPTSSTPSPSNLLKLAHSS
jgi:hypothetical protein